MLGLTALGLRNPKPDVAVAEALLDLEESVARDGGDEAEQIVRGCHAWQSTFPGTSMGVVGEGVQAAHWAACELRVLLSSPTWRSRPPCSRESP